MVTTYMQYIYHAAICNTYTTSPQEINAQTCVPDAMQRILLRLTTGLPAPGAPRSLPEIFHKEARGLEALAAAGFDLP